MANFDLLARCLLIFSAIQVSFCQSYLQAATVLERQSVSEFDAPADYRYSWNISGSRCSYSTESGQYLTRSRIASSKSITQKVVDTCAALCDENSRCGFFHLIQFKGSSEGDVVCALYTGKQSKSTATLTRGPGTSGGSVVVSYGFTATSGFDAPADYRYSWNISGSRCSYSTKSGQYLTRSRIASSKSITQKVVDTCAALCDENSRCGFFHLIQFKGSSEGDVVCALYTGKQSKSTATLTHGPGTSGGSVVVSYGFTATSVSSRTSSRHSTSTGSQHTEGASSTSHTTGKSLSHTQSSKSVIVPSKTSSRSAASASSSFPASPPGARLVQFRGCSSTKHTIPMFVSKKYPEEGSSSSSDTVWIVQHGIGSNFDDYFTSVYNVVGDAGVVIAPNFYAKSDVQAPKSWYQPSSNLAWNQDDWGDGDDAISPSSVKVCSSFDVYDTLIASLHDESRFPNLKRIFVVAHSRGSAMMSRYGSLSSHTDVRYVLANAPVMAYFTSARPIVPSDCPGYDTWAYGWNDGLPRYVSTRNSDGVKAFRHWVMHDITWMTGDFDTYSRDTKGDQSCNVQAQGGKNRRDRGYAFWAYINLLGGTDTDVSDYYGYDSLRDQVASVSPSAFNVRTCVVDGVAHDNHGMFASDCGRAAINGAATIPAGPGPIRPS